MKDRKSLYLSVILGLFLVAVVMIFFIVFDSVNEHNKVFINNEVTGISLNKTTLSLNVGGSTTLTKTITPSNATNQTVTWTSSNTSIATVDSNLDK